MIRGFLSRQYDGSYIFSKWRPEIKHVGMIAVLHQAERNGQVDPWWFGLQKTMCEASVAQQGIELELLESRRCIWSLQLD